MAEARGSAREYLASQVLGRGVSGYERLRRANFALFLLLPLAILFSRGVAEVIVAVIGASFLIVCVRSGRWAWLREAPIALAMALWVFLNLVVSPWAIDQAESFSRSLPWIRFVMFYAAVTAWLVVGERDLRLVTWWMAAVVALVTLDVLTQALSGMSLSGNPLYGNRLTGPLDRPNIGMLLAKFGFPTLGLLAWTSRRASTRWASALTVALGALALVAILLTGERGATVLTLLVLLMIIVFLFVAYSRWRIAAASSLAVLVGAVGTVVAVEDRIRARVVELVDTVSRFGETIYSELFALSVRMFADHPLSGVGLKNFREACPSYHDAGLISICMPHSHNIYLEWLSETGAVGFVLFVAFVVSLFVAFARSARHAAADAVAMLFLLGALLMNLFPVTASQSFFSNWPALLLWFSVALAMAAARVLSSGPLSGGTRGSQDQNSLHRPLGPGHQGDEPRE